MQNNVKFNIECVQRDFLLVEGFSPGLVRFTPTGAPLENAALHPAIGFTELQQMQDFLLDNWSAHLDPVSDSLIESTQLQYDTEELSSAPTDILGSVLLFATIDAGARVDI